MTTPRPTRCALLVPASNGAMIRKAFASDADMIMVDFDDAVVYEDDVKKGAQRTVVETMNDIDRRGKEVTARVNALDTPWWKDDVKAAVECGIKILTPPKVDTASDVRQYTDLLDTLPNGENVRLIPMIETTGAVVNCEDIAKNSPRLIGLCFGIGDYTVSVRADFIDKPDRVAYPLGKIVCVARYHGLIPLAPAVAFSDMRRDDIVEEWGTALKLLGYDGALVIHPRHVPIINGIFSPSRAEIDSALEMRQAIEEARAQNRAAVIIGGKLVEKVNIDVAMRVLAIAEKLDLVEAVSSV